MSRVFLGTHSAGLLIAPEIGGEEPRRLLLVPGELAQLKYRSDGTNAPHWPTLTGGASSTAAIESSAGGTLDRYIDPGEYTLTVNGSTFDIDAVSGSTAADVMSVSNDISRLVADASKAVGILAGVGTGRTAADNAATINAHLATGKHVFIPGNAAGTAYDHAEIVFPVSSHGGQTLLGEGATRSRLHYTGTGYGITFGDGSTTDTRHQSVQGVELVGNVSALGAVKFDSTRWCSVKRCDIREFTNASAHAILISGATANRANYFNVLEDVQFTNNTSHVKLQGNADGTGANSNYLHRCHFSLSTDQNVLIDGGDSNRIYKSEHGDPSPIGVKIIGTAINNVIEDNAFDDPVKAWDIASSAVGTELLWNKQSVDAISSSTDASTTSVRRDKYTASAVAVVTRSNAQGVGTASIDELLFDTDTYDPSDMHSTSVNTGRLTVAIAGLYRISAHVNWAPNATGERELRITKNGTSPVLVRDTRGADPVGTSVTAQGVSCLAVLAVGDFVSARVYQTSGGSINIEGGGTPSPQFAIERVQ